jgi:hypothetical protein
VDLTDAFPLHRTDRFRFHFVWFRRDIRHAAAFLVGAVFGLAVATAGAILAMAIVGGIEWLAMQILGG